MQASFQHTEGFPSAAFVAQQQNNRLDAPVPRHGQGNADDPQVQPHPIRTDRATRTTMVENREIYMVNFTSPAARSPLEKGPEMG